MTITSNVPLRSGQSMCVYCQGYHDGPCPYSDAPKPDAATLRAALEAVEWNGVDGGTGRRCRCVMCGREKRDGHAPDCIVGKALRRV
jgi:hypothetical protein